MKIETIKYLGKGIYRFKMADGISFSIYNPTKREIKNVYRIQKEAEQETEDPKIMGLQGKKNTKVMVGKYGANIVAHSIMTLSTLSYVLLVRQREATFRS